MPHPPTHIHLHVQHSMMTGAGAEAEADDMQEQPTKPGIDRPSITRVAFSNRNIIPRTVQT